MRRVLVVGCNPSPHNLCALIPFLGTKSGKVLELWMKEIGCEHYTTVNAVSVMGKSQTVVKKEHMQKGAATLSTLIKNNNFTHIITLGDIADKVVKMTGLNVHHKALPHPSPLNRKLNNKEYVKKFLRECQIWLGE